MASLPSNSGVFIVQHHSKNYLNYKHPNISDLNAEFMAGSIASFFSLGIFVPTELLKCRAQMKLEGNINYSIEV